MLGVKSKSNRWLTGVAAVLAAYAIVGGLTSFLGWVLDMPRLASWEDPARIIVPNNALAAVSAGLGSLLILLRFPMVCGVLGALVMLDGAAVIFEYRTGIDLGIDSLLLFDRAWGMTSATPGRMGLPAATAWTMIGAGLVLVSISERLPEGRNRSRVAAMTVVMIALAISMLSLIGYLYGATTFYSLPNFTAIAFQTSTFVFAASLSIVLSLDDIGVMALVNDAGPAGVLARRVAPAIFFLPLLLGLLSVAGESAGLYDVPFGTATRTLVEITLFMLLLAWAASAIRKQSVIATEKSEAAIRSDRNFQQMAEAMPQVVWIADNTGHVHYFNERVSTFAGVTQFPDGTYDWRPVIHGDDLDATVSAWQGAVNSKRNYGTEHRIQTSDGSYRWHLSRAVPILGADGEIEKWYGTATDIHDLKEVETELQVINEDLEIRVTERTYALAEANRSLVDEMAEREAAEAEKLQLLRRLVNSQEVERSRIARDLHDQLGQRLTALRLKIESLKDLSGSSEELALRVARLQEIGAKLDEEASFLAWELRPAALDDLGLVEALSTYVSEWSKHHDTKAYFHSSNAKASLSTDTKTHLYRIAQEALNNVAKYAKAATVTVMLERRSDDLLMIIEDDGIGFDLSNYGRREGSTKGLGILGMHERSALIGGEVEIESSPGSGTTVYTRVAAFHSGGSDIHVSTEPTAILQI